MSEIILRVFSKAGRSRVEISTSKTFADLKKDLATRLGVDAAAIKIWKDDKFK